jgi:hypothetical protein
MGFEKWGLKNSLNFFSYISFSLIFIGLFFEPIWFYSSRLFILLGFINVLYVSKQEMIKRLVRTPFFWLSIFSYLISFFNTYQTKGGSFSIFEIQASLFIIASQAMNINDANLFNFLTKHAFKFVLIGLFCSFSYCFLLDEPFLLYDRLKILNSPNSLGFYCQLFYVACILKFHTWNENYASKYDIFLLTIFFYFLIVLTDSRISFISFLMIFILSGLELKIDKIKIVAITLLMMLIPTCMHFIPGTQNVAKRLSISGYERSPQDPNAEKLERQILNGRRTIWTLSSLLILERPVTGYGRRMFGEVYSGISTEKLRQWQKEYKLFQDETPSLGSTRDPHNLFLGLAFDYGIVYAIIFFLILFLTLINNFRSYDLCSFFLKAIVSIYLFYGISNYNLHRPIPEIVLLLLTLPTSERFAFKKTEINKHFY